MCGGGEGVHPARRARILAVVDRLLMELETGRAAVGKEVAMIVLCAVCEKEIEENDALMIHFQGADYPLCTEACRKEFEADSESYAEEGSFEEVY